MYVYMYIFVSMLIICPLCCQDVQLQSWPPFLLHFHRTRCDMLVSHHSVSTGTITPQEKKKGPVTLLVRLYKDILRHLGIESVPDPYLLIGIIYSQKM